MEIQSLDVSLAANAVTIICTDTILTYKIMKQKSSCAFTIIYNKV
ncbi:hypothetical protein BOVA115_1250 [Bacteroides ovatus]|nr:hypothetical protein BOVA115_1250 [Bacteroides ovatus]